MKRTGRPLVILTAAAVLAALTPALADTGTRAPVPAPAPAGDDPVRIGIGVGGALIDIVSPDEHDDEGDEDNGDEDNGDEDNGDEDGDHDGDGLIGLLLGNGDDNGDGDGDGVLEELLNVVERVLDILLGEDEDSAGPPDGVQVAAAPPAEDDRFEELPDVLEALLDDGLLELPEDVLEELLDLVADSVEGVVCVVGRKIENLLSPSTTTSTQPPACF